jgi:hypothetical protein
MQQGDNPHDNAHDNAHDNPHDNAHDNPLGGERRPLSTDDLAAPRGDTTAAHEGDDVGRAADRPEHDQTTLEERDRDRVPADSPFPRPGAGEARSLRQQAGERGPAAADEAAAPPLLPSGESDKFRVQWHEIQALFVDDPPEAVRSADQLVAEVMQAVATSFNNHKHELERQWQRGEEVSTEDLRLALRQYRSFFTRLLST